MTAALEGGEWSAARPGRTLPPGKTRYLFYRRLGGPQGRSGRAENLVLTGIRSRTVQPAVNRYTDWATGPTLTVIYIYLYNKRQVSVFYPRFRLYGHANNLWCGTAKDKRIIIWSWHEMKHSLTKKQKNVLLGGQKYFYGIWRPKNLQERNHLIDLDVDTRTLQPE